MLATVIRFLAWLANWWSLLAMVLAATWWSVRAWKRSGSSTKKKINSVIIAGCVGYVGVQMIPMTWKAQHHRERARSMDVRFVETPHLLSAMPEVAAFLATVAPNQKPFARVFTVDDQVVVSMVRRQSNRDLSVAIDTLIADVSSTRISAGELGGTAACQGLGSGAICGWTNYGITGTISSKSMTPELLGQQLPALRGRVEQRVDRYHPYTEGLNFSLLILGLVLLVVACTISHELSHASFARLLGCDVLVISIGAGRTLIDRDFRGVRVLIKMIPLGGYVQNVHGSHRGYRWRQAIISAAGPIENFALALAFSQLLSPNHPTVILNLVMGAVNLVPFSKFIPDAGTRIGTDGYQMIQVLTGKRTYNPDSVTAGFEVRAEIALERNRPEIASQWINNGLTIHPNNPALLELQQQVSARPNLA